MAKVSFPYQYFPDPTRGKPLFNGSIYIGAKDTDPEVEANQVQVFAVQESGGDVAIPQPLKTGSGGVIMYNGSAVDIRVSELTYSLKLLDANGKQVYYKANAVSDLGDIGIYPVIKENVTLADGQTTVNLTSSSYTSFYVDSGAGADRGRLFIDKDYTYTGTVLTLLNSFPGGTVLLAAANDVDLDSSSIVPTPDTVAALKALDLESDTLVETKGYYTPGDGGGASYLIKTAADFGGTPDGYGDHALVNGNVAVLLNATAIRYGCESDGVTDDTLPLQAYIDSTTNTAELPNGIKFTEISLKSDLRLSGGKVVAGKININGLSDVVISGIRFDYAWANSGADVIYIENSTCRVESCDFERIGNQYPIRFKKSSVEIVGNKINNATYGIENVNTDDAVNVPDFFNESVIVSGNKLSNIAGSAINFTSVVDTQGSPAWESGWDRPNSLFGSVVIEGNSIEDITGFATVYRSWGCVFSGNIVKRAKPPTFQGGNITCANNNLKGMVTVGIDFGNVTRGSLTGNVIDTCEYAAIEVNACKKVTVANNAAQDYSKVTTSGKASAGIWVHGASATQVPSRASTELTIFGNQLAVGTGAALYGISIEDTDSTGILAFNQMQDSASTTEIVSDSIKVRAFGNMNTFAYSNDRINHDGTLTDITIPSAP